MNGKNLQNEKPSNWKNLQNGKKPSSSTWKNLQNGKTFNMEKTFKMEKPANWKNLQNGKTFKMEWLEKLPALWDGVKERDVQCTLYIIT